MRQKIELETVQEQFVKCNTSFNKLSTVLSTSKIIKDKNGETEKKCIKTIYRDLKKMKEKLDNYTKEINDSIYCQK